METSIVSAVCIGRNCLLGNGKKIAKFLMRTFTCRSTFLYVLKQCESFASGWEMGRVGAEHQREEIGLQYFSFT
jgi:hypothetical protein